MTQNTHEIVLHRVVLPAATAPVHGKGVYYVSQCGKFIYSPRTERFLRNKKHTQYLMLTNADGSRQQWSVEELVALLDDKPTMGEKLLRCATTVVNTAIKVAAWSAVAFSACVLYIAWTDDDVMSFVTSHLNIAAGIDNV